VVGAVYVHGAENFWARPNFLNCNLLSSDGYSMRMPKAPMIPPQPADDRSESRRFDAFAKKLLAVPRAQIGEA
jgi:hypothetical protein